MVKGQQNEAKERRQRDLVEKQHKARQKMGDKMADEERQRLEYEAMVA
jgi:hypothetical protein